MAFFRVWPQRPSNIWNYSRVENGVPLEVVFAYDFWSPDALFHDMGQYFVTRPLAHALNQSGLTGFSTTDVPTIKSKTYDETSARGEPQLVAWLKVHGRHGQDDFGIQNNAYLIVSERALALIRKAGFKEGRVLDYDPNHKPESMEEFWARWGGTPGDV
jgi:hypothetical protein